MILCAIPTDEQISLATSASCTDTDLSVKHCGEPGGDLFDWQPGRPCEHLRLPLLFSTVAGFGC